MTVSREKWEAVYNRVFKTDGKQMATVVANTFIKRELGKQKEAIARSKQFRTIKFELDTSGEFIKRDKAGNDYISFGLADTDNDVDFTYTPELLQSWADKINAGDMLIGDLNHTEFDKLTMVHCDESIIKEKLKNKKGIAKVVRAIYENGKLWVKAFIDKRYRKVIEKAKVSLEAFVNPGDTKTEGDLLGFTFMTDGQESGNPTLSVS